MYIPGTSSIESGFIFSSLNVGLTSQSLQLTFAILLGNGDLSCDLSVRAKN